MKAFIPAVLILTGLAVAAPQGEVETTDAGRRERIERGAALYEVYCANCHGVAGVGDGPTAKILSVRPADLTRIAERNGGEFPFERVRRTIDGRNGVRGHGRSGMPIWGLAFQQLDQVTNQEREIQARILQLTRYVESIQTPAD